VCYSQQTQTDTSWSAQHRQLRSATLNIPKLSISIDDTGPKGTLSGIICNVSDVREFNEFTVNMFDELQSLGLVCSHIVTIKSSLCRLITSARRYCDPSCLLVYTCL